MAMRPLSRAAPLFAGALLSFAAAAQTSDATAVLLSDIETHRVTVHDGSSAVQVVGRVSPATPVVSGEVHVWATLSPVQALVPLADPAGGLDVGPALGGAVEPGLPAEVALRSVYPNPLTSRARIPFELPEAARARVAVYDALGREVAVLVDGEAPAGWHEAPLDALRLAPGLYHVRLSVGTFVGTTRFTVVR
jgi:hypothetical protein